MPGQHPGGEAATCSNRVNHLRYLEAVHIPRFKRVGIIGSQLTPLDNRRTAALPVQITRKLRTILRDYPLASNDVNGDGIVEIGFLVPPAGTESFAPLATPFISKYYQWDGASGLIFTEEQFDRWGFNFHLPASWAGKTLLETPAESPNPWENIRFSYKSAATAEQAPLLELRLLAKNDWPSAEAELKAQNREYKLLYELQNTNDGTAPTVYVAVMPAAGAAAKLTGASLQEYSQLKLTLEEAVELAGSPQKPRP